MVDWFIRGSILGISIGLLVGPLFFALIHAGIESGFRKGIVFALGTWLSDLILLLLTYFLLSKFIIPKTTEEVNPIIIVACSGALIILGFNTMMVKTEDKDPNYVPKAKDLLGLMGKGFLINTFNPAAFFIWLGLGTMIKNLNTTNSNLPTISFYFGVISMIILLDSLKVLLGKKISKRMEAGILQKIRWISGIAFIIAGLLLIGKIIS